MKHFLSALALGCLLLSCNRDLENTVPENSKLLLLKKLEPGFVDIGYKNNNEIEYLKIGSFWKKANIEYQYDGSGRIIKEHRFDETSSAYTEITYQYDSQGRLASSNAISARFYPHCSIERKHSYTYHGNSTISVKMELFKDDCTPTLEKKEEKSVTLLIENDRVVKSLDENNQIIETIEYYDTKNALRNIKGFPALVSEFYLRGITYMMPYYNRIDNIDDLKFIDNVKTRDSHNGYYTIYQYMDRNNNEYNGDYPESVSLFEKSHNDPNHNRPIWLYFDRYYTPVE